MLRKFLLVLGVAALGGCATKPVVKDTTPLHPTAIIEKHVTSNGLRGFVPFETNETDYVRTDMRRNDSAFKGTGTFTGFLLGSHSGTRIYRVDRKLLWKLDTDNKQYTECPLQGCAADRAAMRKAKAARQRQPLAQHEQGCTMRIARSGVSVTATGKRENINGFDSHEYKIAWVITLRDRKHRNSTSTLSMDTWTTPLTQDMRSALDMNARYRHSFDAATREGGAQPSDLLPKQAAQLIMSYLGTTLRGRDLRRFFAGGHKVQRIKGHPIRTTLTWDIRGNACAPREQPKQAKAESSHVPTSVSGLVNMFAEHETKKAVADSANEPLLSFTVEVKQLKVTPLHDSVFTVPADYKRVEPK